MATKPILFNTEMVKAILDGRKTQTRRIIKLAPGFTGRQVGESGNPNNPLGFMYPCGIKRPPCNKGDILWVRETWTPFCINKKTCSNAMLGHSDFCYKASPNDCVDNLGCKLHPSIHMPKQAARIFLLVKDVRVERLQEITLDDVHAEGIDASFTRAVGAERPSGVIDFSAERFETLWDSTIKPADRDRYGWYANPWVWVIEFERIEKPKGW